PGQCNEVVSIGTQRPNIPRRKSWRTGARQLPAAFLLQQQQAEAAQREEAPFEDINMIVLQSSLCVDVSSSSVLLFVVLIK
ncbi:hypothetical protein BgiMline_004583, partial [Biomphalaria glabrata]